MTDSVINTAVYERMSAEQGKFRDWLLSQPSEEVLKHTFEYTVREDILLALKDLDLTDKQAESLFRLTDPLSDVFREFDKRETGYMEQIRDCILSRADKAIKRK